MQILRRKVRHVEAESRSEVIDFVASLGHVRKFDILAIVWNDTWGVKISRMIVYEEKNEISDRGLLMHSMLGTSIGYRPLSLGHTQAISRRTQDPSG